MTEERTPAIQNWPLLLIAGVLGLIVAVVYNFHVSRIREGVRGEMVWLLQVKKDLQPGAKIKKEDIDKVQVPGSIAEKMTGVMKGEDYSYVIDKVVNTRVSKDKYLTYSDITQDPSSARPSMNLTPDMVSLSFQVDPMMSPGELLRIGDHVNLVGVFSISGKPANYSIMDGVRVVEVGGHSARDPNARTVSAEGWSTFRTITIEVSPKTALELSNVLSHAASVRVMTRNPNDNFPSDPQINPALKSLMDSAAPGRGGAMIRPEN